ncbi:MAG: hypothetical protein K0R57_2395 [Paenibacillaceae bacterium]|jgi:two-component system sensor histidine kinase YesM|nr:hypothetical protein [Paenibacillaceae bacterium]
MFFSIILFIVASVAVFSYLESSRSIKGDVERSSMQILKEANLNLERYFREYEQFFVQVASSGDFTQWFQGEQRSDPVLSFNRLKDNYFHPFATLHPEVLSITLLNGNGLENHYTTGSGPALRYDYSMKNEAWITEEQSSPGLNMLMTRSGHYVELNNERREVSVLTLFKPYSFSFQKKGWIKMDIALEPIQSILSELKTEDRGSGMIVDKAGMIIAHSNPAQFLTPVPALIESGIRSNPDGFFYSSESEQMITYRNIDKTEWKIISTVPYRDAARSVFRVKNVTIGISLAGLFLALLLVILVSSSSTRKLRQLRRVMLETSLSNMGVRADVDGRDEVADLGRVYNKMLANLEDSLEELGKTRYAQQQAVLSALQSQINSHFLYNALESIKSMAYVANQEEIVRMTLALSELLRYVSNYQNTSVPVQQEIQYVANYMHIMQTQYGEDLTYEIIQEAGTNETLCLKAVIQPIVENSIRYGLEQTGQPLFVRIETVRLSEGCLSIRISDTGPGFDQETLTRMNSKLQDSNVDAHYRQLSNIGLLNVHYRLRVYYKDEQAGITICNRADGNGAEVTVTLPDRPARKGEAANEPNLDCG